MDTIKTDKTVSNLLGGNTNVITESRVLLKATGADVTYPEGLALAYNTVDALLVPYVLGGADGAGTFYGVLAEETELLVASTDKSVVTIIKGELLASGIKFIGAGAVSDIRDDARLKGIYLNVSESDNTPL